ncbi:hypothetical protein AABC73_14940 [Pseudomonas sp. G.S.17]|uniref:hypothetical protein n=1 Tax=Pseudomonas sp. G.S.17 TaxID=3137451 RepID=UPI00311CA52A
MSMREEFERTSVRDTRRQPPKGNNYIDPMAQMDWLAFQKGWEQSRAALVAEFESKKLEVSDDHDDWSERECWNNGITRCQCIADPSIIQKVPA